MKIIGPYKSDELLHGSPDHFSTFDQAKLRSLGFHFGDEAQARYFAPESGFIYRANLSFRNLFDIGKQDWGWTSAPHIAYAFYLACLSGKVPSADEDFYPLLGPKPWDWSKLTVTERLSQKDQLKLIDLFESYECDGIRYINNVEPPDSRGRMAYFVFDTSQIEVIAIEKA